MADSPGESELRRQALAHARRLLDELRAYRDDLLRVAPVELQGASALDGAASAAARLIATLQADEPAPQSIGTKP